MIDLVNIQQPHGELDDQWASPGGPERKVNITMLRADSLTEIYRLLHSDSEIRLEELLTPALLYGSREAVPCMEALCHKESAQGMQNAGVSNCWDLICDL